MGELVPEELVRPGHGPPPILTPYELTAGANCSCACRSPTSRPTRSSVPALPRSSRTSCGRRSRACSRCSRPPSPGTDQTALVEQARLEVEQIRELIDEVLFLSELETGREVVSLGQTRALPVLREVLEGLRGRGRAGRRRMRAEGNEHVELPLRPRMLSVVAENLTENAIRYAGRARFHALGRGGARDAARARPTPARASRREELGRLFERFYRADRARASRGTGLGLAIVKHIVTSAGGTIEARGGPGEGLEIRCFFPD